MLRPKLQKLFKDYFEIAAFSTGLLLLAFMDPEAARGPSFCLFKQLGLSFCPGNELGHSVAYIFRGDISNALQSNILGPAAILILSSRIVYLTRQRIKFSNN